MLGYHEHAKPVDADDEVQDMMYKGQDLNDLLEILFVGP